MSRGAGVGIGVADREGSTTGAGNALAGMMRGAGSGAGAPGGGAAGKDFAEDSGGAVRAAGAGAASGKTDCAATDDARHNSAIAAVRTSGGCRAWRSVMSLKWRKIWRRQGFATTRQSLPAPLRASHPASACLRDNRRCACCRAGVLPPPLRSTRPHHGRRGQSTSGR